MDFANANPAMSLANTQGYLENIPGKEKIFFIYCTHIAQCSLLNTKPLKRHCRELEFADYKEQVIDLLKEFVQ